EGQLYYDSLLELYASWGVDFIKVDDIADSKLYKSAHHKEIAAIRKAIDKTGREIVLSLSPGPRSEERRVGKECRSRWTAEQAEDGIRDFHVTGVQTCALPILKDSYTMIHY